MVDALTGTLTVQVLPELKTIFPREFLDCLPHKCLVCGSGTEITDTLTILRCSNPDCGGKATRRLVAMLKDLGIKNMGDSKCKKFLQKFNVTNPYAIFVYDPADDGEIFEGASMEFSYEMYEQINAKRSMFLWEYIRIGNLKGIRDSAKSLLRGYTDLEDFYVDLEEGGIAFVQEQLEIKGKVNDSYDYDDGEGVSIKAVDVYNVLMENKDNLMLAYTSITIKQLTVDEINLYITDSAGEPYAYKSDFMDDVTEAFKGKVQINLLGAASKECQFLIWGKDGDETGKVKSIKKRNAKRVIDFNKKLAKENVQNNRDEEEGFLDPDADYSLQECLEYGLVPILTGVEFKDYLSSKY